MPIIERAEPRPAKETQEMKPARKNKLAVRKETLRPLDAREMSRVGGGSLYSGGIATVIMGDGLNGPIVVVVTSRPSRSDEILGGGGFSF
jgi:hypothetical protein